MKNQMKTKFTGALLIGISALAIAACGNQDGLQQPATPSPKQEAGGTASPQASYASLYETSVFLGDSITEGLSFHDVLDEANVLAGAGKTAEFALEDLDELMKRKPEHLFILLGSDDILWPTENPREYSLAHYAKLIGTVKDKLPQTKITLLSVLPVTAEAEEQEPRYRNIEAYNQGLRELAEEEQVGFADISPILKDNADLYDADGIHFKAEFYPLMLESLKELVD